MASQKSIWFHIGHALERARRSGPPVRRGVTGLAERRRETEVSEPEGSVVARGPLPATDDLIAAGIAMLVDRTLGGWGASRRPRFTGLLKAGAAGAAAALLVDLLRPLLLEDAEVFELDRDTADHMIAGVAQGLVYAAIVEPRTPGPALLKGALYGSVEYVADPIGGLAKLLGPHAPHQRIPLVGDVFDDLTSHERAFLEHVVFGVALALIYESSPSSNGIRPDDD